MTQNAAIRVAPQTRPAYIAIGIITFLCGCLFAYGALARSHGVLLMAVFAIVSYAWTFQSTERLFRPDFAQRRSDAIAPIIREKLRGVWRMLDRIAMAGFLIGWAARMTATGSIRDLATDIGIVSGFLLLSVSFLADYCGENSRGVRHKYL